MENRKRIKIDHKITEEEVVILVKGQQYKVSKQALCEHSEYFQAMFSRNYRGRDYYEIALDMVHHVESMDGFIIFLDYFEYIRLNELKLSDIYNLAETAKKLQLSELTNIIKYFLAQRVTLKNWFEFRNVAKNMNYENLKQACADFELPLLKKMEPQYVPSVQELVWYLSQNHLYVTNEYDVFKFGIDWMSHCNSNIDSQAVLMFLGCLDMKRVTTKIFVDIKKICPAVCFGFDDSLAAKVIDCLTELSENDEITRYEIFKRETMIKDKYNEAIYDEVLRLVENSRSRIEHTLILSINEIPIKQTTISIRHKCLRSDVVADNAGYYNLYICTKFGIKKWLKLNMCKEIGRYYFTWDIVAWGASNIVLVVNKGAESMFPFFPSRDDDVNKTQIKVYNVLKEEWTPRDVELPNVRVRKVAVVGNSLYIICGGPGFDITYDLVKKSYKTIAKPPCKITNPYIDTRMPLICTRNDQVYICELNIVYKYNDDINKWVEVIEHYTQITNMVSHNDGYIYVIDDAPHNNLLRFKPGEDNQMFAVKTINMDEVGPIINSCSIGDRILFFTNKACIYDEPDSSTKCLKGTICIQEYNTKSGEEGGQFKEFLSLEETTLKIDPYRNVCSVVMTTTPTLYSDVTDYLKQHLMRYNDKK